MRVRQANIEDVPAIFALDRETTTAAHWPPQSYENLFPATDPGQAIERLVFVVEEDSKPPKNLSMKGAGIVAFLVARCVDSEWELENIVVTKAVQCQGVGTLLLSVFVEHTRAKQGNSIFLEVRESNQHARALYRKAGFEETGLRKDYYADPPENATLYRLIL